MRAFRNDTAAASIATSANTAGRPGRRVLVFTGRSGRTQTFHRPSFSGERSAARRVRTAPWKRSFPRRSAMGPFPKLGNRLIRRWWLLTKRSPGTLKPFSQAGKRPRRHGGQQTHPQQIRPVRHGWMPMLTRPGIHAGREWRAFPRLGNGMRNLPGTALRGWETTDVMFPKQTDHLPAALNAATSQCQAGLGSRVQARAPASHAGRPGYLGCSSTVVHRRQLSLASTRLAAGLLETTKGVHKIAPAITF